MTMKRTILLVTIYILLLGMVGCKPPQYNEYSTLSELCEEAEHNEHVKISGVLKLPEIVIYDDRYLVQLVEELSQDQPSLLLRVNKGKSKNRMEPLPDDYTYDDFQVHTADGRTVGHGDAVTLSGRYLSGCTLTVDVVE